MAEFTPDPIVEFTPTPLTEFTPVPITEEPEEETSTFSDIAQGVGAGLIGLPQGIAETGAAVIDSIADTNTSRAVTKGFESAKDFLGLTPETTAGKTAESITTFGAALIPVIGWVGRASSVARGAATLPSKSILKAGADAFGKSKPGKALLGSDNAFTARAKLAATTSLTAGAAEMIVAPDGTATLADSFDVLPDALETEVDSGLQGRDEAARRLRNKLRMGIEGTAVGVGFEALFPVLGVTTRAVSMIPGVPAAARTFSAGFDYLGGKLSGAFDGRVGKYFTSAGETPKNIFEDLRTIDNVTDQEAQTAANLFASFDREARKVVKGQKLFGRGKEGVQKAYDDLLSFLEGDVKALDDYGKNVVTAANKMRNQVDELTDRGIKELEDSVAAGTVNRDLADAAIKEMEHNRGSYLRRLYEGAFDPETVSMKQVEKKPAYKKAVDQLAKAMQSSDSSLTTQDAVSNAKLEIAEFLTKTTLDERLDKEVAMKIMSKSVTDGRNAVGERPLYQLSEDMFKKRTKFMERAPALRELLNEVRDPKELYIRTVSDLSKFSTSNKFFREFAQTERVSYDDAIDFFNAGSRPLVVSGENLTPTSVKTLLDNGYTQLGGQTRKAIEGKGSGKTIFSGKFGDLTGEYVPIEIKNALTTPVRNTNIATELLAISLQAKGISQMGKTVLNPIGQVRNFLSGTFMVGANGNLPRTTELGEAFDAVFKKASALSDEESDKFFSMIGDLGLVDENLAVNEMQLLLREQYGKTSAKSATNLNSLIEKTPGVRGLQKIYSDTDTFWKTVGFIGEKAKYGAAFRKAGLDPDNLGDISSGLVQSGLAPRTSELTGRHGFLNVFASDIVKETMPIYSRVPEVIKSIRRIPVAGNFVAFPAEVIRNTANIVQRGTRELGFKASDELIESIKSSRNFTDEQAIVAARQLEREVRAIGANRLTSYIASASVIPAAVAKASYAATGVSEEDVEAMKPLMPYFMEGHLIMSLGKPKDGKWEHADLSYMMPYDFAFTPARRAMEIYKQKGEIGAGEAEQITASMWGAFASFMDPFAGESLIAERVQDALPQDYFGRGGETATGSPIWQDSNDFGTKLGNSFTHILGGFTPTFLELFVKPTARGLEAGRVSSAATGDPTRTGREYNIHEEAFTAATGMRKLELNIPKSLSYKGYEFTSLRSQSLGDFARVAKANNSSEEDVINAYVAANEDAFRAQRQMYGFMKAAEAAGLSRAQIFTALKRDSNLGSEELAFIMSGKFRPVTISDKVVRDVYAETAIKGEPRKITKLPMRGLLDKSREYTGKSLLSESLTQEVEQIPTFAPEPVSPEPTFTPEPVSQAPTIAPTQQVAASGAPPPVAQAGGVNPLASPAPLSGAGQQLQRQLAGGGDPINAIKNLQATGNV